MGHVAWIAVAIGLAASGVATAADLPFRKGPAGTQQTAPTTNPADGTLSPYGLLTDPIFDVAALTALAAGLTAFAIAESDKNENQPASP